MTKKTLKAAVLDFVEKNGPTRRKDIVKLMCEIRFQNCEFDPIRYRGQYSSYFHHEDCFFSPPGCLRKPTKTDPRYLVQIKPYGPYTIAYAK